MSVTQIRAERLVDERARIDQNIEDMRSAAETDGGRDLNELETEQVEKWRTRRGELDTEIEVLTEDIERANNSRDVSKLIRVHETPPANGGVAQTGGPESPIVYRTFAAYARDQIISRFPIIASEVAGTNNDVSVNEVRERALERLQRTLENTTSDVIEGLLPPQHMAEIMDIIDTNRPVVSTARRVDLTRGKLTYPKITQRPQVTKQSSEKTEAGTAAMNVDLADMSADTYLGGGNISWQTINWSTPDALQLWFTLAAEAYARQTETAACASLEAAASGTASPTLGTSGTESFGDWRSIALQAVGDIYSTTQGRAKTNTLYLAADQFFTLAALATDAVVQMSAVGNLDIATMTGTFSGLRVVGSYGFQPGTRFVGDSSAFLVGETPGAPVELRAVEPAIGGMEVGVIGAFQSKVFDPDRFLFLS